MERAAGPAAIPIAYTRGGEPWLHAQPLAPADLCDPGGAWSVLRPPGEDHLQVAGNFTGVAFPTPDIGYVRAMDGLLIKTEDGGRTWRFLRHDLPTPGATLDFPTPSVGYLSVRRVRLLQRTGRPVLFEASWTLGTAQTLLRTDDGGRRWDLLTPLVDAPLPGRNRAFLPYTGDYDPAVVTEQIRDAAAGVDAPHGLPGALGYLDQVVFPNSRVGYALMHSDSGWPPEACDVLRSSDDGHTWGSLPIGRRLGTKATPPRMSFPQANSGFLMAQEALFCTGDAGVTWEARPYPTQHRPASMAFPTASIGYALAASRLPRVVRTREEMDAKDAEARALFRTEDAGLSWRRVGDVVAMRLLGCAGPEVVLAIGGDGRARRSADGGRAWHDVDTLAPHRPQAVACPDERTCYAVASNATILKSDDGGRRWHALTTGLAALYDLLDGGHLLHHN